MKSLSDRLLQSAACSRRFLEGNSREKIYRFVLSRQNSDGGFRGRGAGSDPVHTLFAVAVLKAIDYPVPVFKVWKYIHSPGLGKTPDLARLASLFRLRSAYPMLGTTRRRFLKRLEEHPDRSAVGLFLKRLAEDDGAGQGGSIQIAPEAPTAQIAAAALANGRNDPVAEKVLLSRFFGVGGFAPTTAAAAPDLLSTAAAITALAGMGVNLGKIQKPCFKYVDSLWRGSGGFARHAADETEDVECTFYALLTIGCLIQSMAKNYGT